MNAHPTRFFLRILRVLWIALTVGSLATAQESADEAERPARRIEARSAVKRALTHNPAVRAAELNVAQTGQTVKAEEGRYPYILQADAGYTTREIPLLAPDDSVTTSLARSYTIGTAVRRTFPMGTVSEVRVQGERFDRDVIGVGVAQGRSLGEGYGITARATLAQPLLRGAGVRVGEVELRAARVSQALAEKTQTRLTSEVVRDVLVTYWELWYATEALGIERAALGLAERQHSDAQEQVTLGALAPANALVFETRVLQLQEAVVIADIVRRQRALELGQLMGGPEDSDGYFAASEPTAGARTSHKALEAALRADSVELAELEEQVRLARTRAGVAGENVRPRLDVEAFMESQGVSEAIPRAAERAAEFSWITAHIGLVFELPLADARRQAEQTAAVLAVRIAEENLKAARNRIAAQAALAVANDTATRERLSLAERTLAAATRAYEAERLRFELGQSLPVQVLQAEEELRRARLRVARARVDVAQVEADVLHLLGKLLVRYG
jgi:outer membrane protein TolC